MGALLPALVLRNRPQRRRRARGDTMSNVPQQQMRQLQQQYETEVQAFNSLAKDLQKNQSVHSQFQTQLSENTMVLKKLDLVEAKSNVGKRLEYIEGEMKRLETSSAGIKKKQSDRQKEIMKIQERVKDVEHQVNKMVQQQA